MSQLPKLGRLFFSFSLAFFAAQYFYFGRFLGGLPPVPPWTPGALIAAYLTGAILLTAAILIVIDKKSRAAAIVLGFFFLACVLFLHTLHLSAIIHSGTDRTRALEPFALAGAAFVLANLVPRDNSPLCNKLAPTLSQIGRQIFAFSLIVFGAQHFMYAQFLATLVPAWMPAHLFLIEFTGAAFIAAALSIATKIFVRPAAALLGLMFLLWFLFLHAPRVAAALHNADEWTSAFVALCFSGASFFFIPTNSEQP